MCMYIYIYISTIVEIASPENHALISILVACMNPLDYFWLYTVGAGLNSCDFRFKTAGAAVHALDLHGPSN